ncbi:hypothetical protein QBC39DRAFT_187118 [Podospora conica]|nr:hypothetical protein QBC39DRAFT_187118 [Schizothecium conicum]
MHLSVLLAAAAAALVRAEQCPDPTADGWIAQRPQNFGQPCYWQKCGEYEGRLSWAPASYVCRGDDRCKSDQAEWCVGRRGDVYQGDQEFLYRPPVGKRDVDAAVERAWVA